MSSDDDSFEPSVLGTKEHWDNVYEREIQNFEDHGDIGEIWFGEDSVEKMIDWISDHIEDKDIRTIDLGCGNGHLLLELSSLGFSDLTGVDYSQHSIALAKKIAMDRNVSPEITYAECDILNPPQEYYGSFELALDKGTLDAISLMNDGAGKKLYAKNVASMLRDDGLLLITSCNWTEQELVEILGEYFTVTGRVKYPKFQFGGVEGQKIATVAFSKK